MTGKPPHTIKTNVPIDKIHDILKEVYELGEPKSPSWTNWEFKTIVDNPALFNKTTFWTGTKQVTIDASQFGSD